MIFNILTIIAFFSFSGCGSKGEIVELKTNGFIQERRYYNISKSLIGIVHFKKESSRQGVPLDSISYEIKSTGELMKVAHFNYENGKYKGDDNSPLLTLYEALFSRLSGCNELKDIINAYILIEAKNDVCNITGSVLSNGHEASELRKVQTDSTSEGVQTIITYEPLNSSFLSLSEDIQSYFYQQPLQTLKIILMHNLLIKEDYQFSDGRFTREYIYNKNKILASVIISVHQKDTNKIEQIIKEYSHR